MGDRNFMRMLNYLVGGSCFFLLGVFFFKWVDDLGSGGGLFLAAFPM